MKTEKQIKERIEGLKLAREECYNVGSLDRIDSGIRTLNWVLGDDKRRIEYCLCCDHEGKKKVVA